MLGKNAARRRTDVGIRGSQGVLRAQDVGPTR